MSRVYNVALRGGIPLVNSRTTEKSTSSFLLIAFDNFGAPFCYSEAFPSKIPRSFTLVVGLGTLGDWTLSPKLGQYIDLDMGLGRKTRQRTRNPRMKDAFTAQRYVT